MGVFSELAAQLGDRGQLPVWRALRQLVEQGVMDRGALAEASLAYARALAARSEWQAAAEVAGAGLFDTEQAFVASGILADALSELGRIDQAIVHSRFVFDRAPKDFTAFQRHALLLDRAGLHGERLDACTLRQTLLDTDIATLPRWLDPGGPDSAYLDLLERVILNTIYEDVSSFRGQVSAFNPQLRQVGSDKPALAHSMIGFRRLRHLRRAVETVLAENIPGDFIETGVWRGGACILMRGILKDRGERERLVYVADSFEGLPPPDPRHATDALSLIDFHLHDELAVSLDVVRANFGKYDLLDDQVVMVKGFFADTLPPLRDGQFAILRLDGDLYSSTMDALDSLYDAVVPGGFVIIDDYGSVLDAQRAVLDFRARRGIAEPMTAIDFDGAFWRKPAG